jgi:integrase
MSSAFDATAESRTKDFRYREPGANVPLGAQKPGDPEWICVMCPDCKRKRWARKSVRGIGAYRARGFLERDPSCASRNTQNRRAAAKPDVPVPSGSIYRPSVKKVVCGICKTQQDDYRRPKAGDKGFCKYCWPWARIALRPEHDAGPSAERDAIYAKIRNIRRALEGASKGTPKGAQIPFCFLAKKWDERNPQANQKTNDSQSYHVRLLSFYFGTTPIGEITYDKGVEFKDFLLNLPPTRGAERGSKRSESSVNQTLMALRNIVEYAREQGRVRKNPFPIGGDFTPSRRERKPTPLVTVEEEARLLAACTDKLEYLRAIIICLLDTGMKDADRQRLKWSDIDFETGLIRGSGVPIRMTPRLLEAMHSLRNKFNQNPEAFVWGSGNITGLKKDLGLARKVAHVQGAHISHCRPTAAWRMIEAGQEFRQVAAVLGCTAEILEQYLRTDPDAAEQEKDSLSFKQFVSEQLGGVGNRNGQKNDTHRPRSDRDEWLLEIIAKVAERWHKYPKVASEPERQDNLSRIKQEYVADDLGLTVTGLRGRLDECGWREMFPEAKKRFPVFVAFIAENLDRGETKEEILEAMRALAIGGAQKSQ